MTYTFGQQSGDLAGYGPTVYSGTVNAGTPTAGTAGYLAGVAYPGAEAISVAAATRFVNTGTKASPTWTKIT